MTDAFFSAQSASSRIKALIVSSYFPQYCRIIHGKSSQEKMVYMDLFAGPGIYDDGQPSTPILIGQQIEKDRQLRGLIQFVFNDNIHAGKLESHFNAHFPAGTFAHVPEFHGLTTGEDQFIDELILRHHINPSSRPFPTLLFIDPFGYKGINTAKLSQFMNSFGNELFLFVNTKRLHPALENDKFDELVQRWFPTTLESLRHDRRYSSSVGERLQMILDNLAAEYQSSIPGKLFTTAFRFQEEDSRGTSHYIVHFTKHRRGYDLIKQIYDEFDNVGAVLRADGTYTFDAKLLEARGDLFTDSTEQNVDSLAGRLRKDFEGACLTAYQLYESHQHSGPYSRRHYTQALRKLASNGALTAEFTDGSQHRVTVLINLHCLLTFS